MKRVVWVDLLVVLLLFCVGLALRLPLLPLIDVSSDATDPIVGALRILRSWNPFLTDSPRFGYGRALSYVPLVLGAEEGLSSVAARRAVAQALVAPVTYLSMRLLLSRLETRVSWVLGPLAGGLLLAVNQDLLQNLVWGHHGYFGPEWAALLLLGFAGLLVGDRPRLWALLAGVSLAMCVMNHPYAISATPVLLVALWSARRDGDTGRVRAVLLALGLAAAALLPHLVYLVTAPGVSVRLDLFESVAPASLLDLQRPLQVASWLFSNVAAGEGVLFLVAVLLVLVVGFAAPSPGRPAGLARVARRLGLATCVTVFGLLILALISRQVHNWHWRMLLPFAAACSGLALAWLAHQLEVGGILGRRGLAVVLGLCIALGLVTQVFREGVEAYRHPAEEARESLLQLSQVERVYALLEADSNSSPWTLLAYGLPAEQTYARTLPLVLQRILKRNSRVTFAGTPDRWLQGPTLVYFEAPGPWIAALSASSSAEETTALWRGAESLAMRTDSAVAALRLGTALCVVSAGAPLYADSPRDSLALLGEAGLVGENAAIDLFPVATSCTRPDR